MSYLRWSMAAIPEPSCGQPACRNTRKTHKMKSAWLLMLTWRGCLEDARMLSVLWGVLFSRKRKIRGDTRGIKRKGDWKNQVTVRYCDRDHVIQGWHKGIWDLIGLRLTGEGRGGDGNAAQSKAPQSNAGH